MDYELWKHPRLLHGVLKIFIIVFMIGSSWSYAMNNLTKICHYHGLALPHVCSMTLDQLF